LPKLTIRDTGPLLDGDYELAMPPYTQKEWHQIKSRTGLRPLDLEDAWQSGDPDVMAAFAWVSATRAGKEPNMAWNALGELDVFTSLTFDFGEEEEEEPVPLEPTTPTDTEPASEPEPDDSTGNSGATTNGPSESLVSDPRAIGILP